MNLELLRTFDASYPEHNDGVLDSGSEALITQFNRRGTMLAVGCNDGRIALWDFMTRGISRQCSHHVHPITSLSWNRSGKKLLSSATDWNVVLWDVVSGEAELCLRFPSPVAKVQFNPRDKGAFIVCPMRHAPTLVRLEGEGPVHVPLSTDGEPETSMTGSFDRHGKQIIIGSSKGKVIIIDVNTLDILKTFRVYSGGSSLVAIKSIEVARRGSNFLINGSDRVLRVYDLENLKKEPSNDEEEEEEGGRKEEKGEGERGKGGKEIEVDPLQRLQDNVNRMQWKKCTFSGDGDYICAGSHRQHELYIWDKATGNLVKILTGPKGESLLDLTWHPVKPVILSVSNGLVNIWSHAQTELWSAYAPNFKELDENEDYEERESEFDIEDEDKSIQEEEEGRDGGNEEVLVDVTDSPVIPAFCSSEEDEETPLDWLPYAPEVEEPEEPGWGQLEPALNELPSNKRACKDDGDEGEESASKRPRPLTVDVELPEPVNEVVQVKPGGGGGGGGGKKNSSKNKK